MLGAARQAARLCSRSRGCSSAAQAQAAEGDSRVMAYALGALSTVPFLALTPAGFEHCQRLASANAQPLPFSADDAAKLQVLYGCTVLSFLGAPHWGLAMANAGASSSMPLANIVRYAWGVTPSLLAWPVPALPQREAQGILVTSFAGAFAVDAVFARLQLLPRFYLLGMRLPLTLVATTALLSNVRPPAPMQPTMPTPPPPPPPRKGWW